MHPLSNPKIISFIKKHEHSDVAELALRGPPEDLLEDSGPWAEILDQIKSRQKAFDKIPDWCTHEGIIFPKPSLMEQASSAATARYKASLISGKNFVDLCAGAGVDCAAFADVFERGMAVDADENATDLLRHNFSVLGKKNITLHHVRAEDFVNEMHPVDMAYIDPQRRTSARKGKFRFEDCAPDILKLLPVLKKHAKTIMIKASPMLDLEAGVHSLGGASEIHVVEWRGQCREILFVLNRGEIKNFNDVSLHAVVIDDENLIKHRLSFTPDQEQKSVCVIGPPGRYLYESFPAFQKSGGFKTIGAVYGLTKLHQDTHLYSGDALCENFPGRVFEICAIYPGSTKKFPFEKANISIRNFPGDVETLRKKLKLKDGGGDYIFACTLHTGARVFIHARKLPVSA